MMAKTERSDERFARNAGFINGSQQASLAEARIVIAGVGGVGGRVATELIRLGCLKLRLADPDIFSITNLNRQEGSFESTIGRPKAEVIAALCRDINPAASIEVFPAGVDQSNVDEFLSDATLLVEATDFMLPYLGVMLARKARAQNIPVLMGVEIGFGATLTWFKPNGYTYERYFGLPADVSLAELEAERVTVNISRWLPHVPSYGDMSVLQRVSSGKIDVPAIAPAVDICAALITTQVMALLSGSAVLPAAPSVFHFDAKEHKSRVIRFRWLHHRWSLMVMMINNMIGHHDTM